MNSESCLVPSALSWVAACVLLQSTAAGLVKQAGLWSLGRGIAPILLNPWLFGAFCCLGLQAFCWVLALRKLPLSFAYPFMSLVLPLTLLCSWAVFKEPVTTRNLAGMAFIFLGALLLAIEVRQ